jgi:hypothetical protein
VIEDWQLCVYEDCVSIYNNDDGKHVLIDDISAIRRFDSARRLQITGNTKCLQPLFWAVFSCPASWSRIVFTHGDPSLHGVIAPEGQRILVY